ncbi:MAG TPA: glutathione S-transferase family protein [Verrucomicrobiae bacterium]|jgi:glutathione S-transferase|nr:glutathione S-transferase family protein [Verrucomicrobiae bacterium]
MIEMYQLPWSPFCLVQKRILEYAGAKYKAINVPSGNRAAIWRVTRERYYAVPVIRDVKTVVFETDEHSQVVAKYLSTKFELGLFPKAFQGIDRLLWRYIEDEVEGSTFRLNDVYYREFVPKADWLNFVRHKERKFGRGCLEQWRDQQAQLQEKLAAQLIPFELMLQERPFLLRAEPHFIDFDLWGMLSNFLYSGHYQLPAAHTRLNDWHARLSKLKKAAFPSEKLHT